MNKKQKKMLWRIIITSVLFLGLNIFSVRGIAGTCLYLVAYLVIGYDILKKA